MIQQYQQNYDSRIMLLFVCISQNENIHTVEIYRFLFFG